MLSTRRLLTYLVLVISFTFLLTRFRETIVDGARVRYDAIFPAATKHPNHKFHWADVPVRYSVTQLTPLPTSRPQKLPKVQFDFNAETNDHVIRRKERQATVKATFERCWKAYKQHAWMMDEVTPITGASKNGFGGWAATLVDSLDILWIMGLKDEFEEAVQAAMEIDLGMATTEVINVFETTIRHLGGLLAAYDVSGDERLLTKAKEFGEMLLKAFDTPNRMPITRWKPQAALHGKQEADSVVLVAEIGSLTMEFTRLSQLTQDSRWYDAVNRIMRTFVQQMDQTHLTNMFPVVVDAKDMDFTQDTFFTLGAMSDSLYEYFPKMHALLGGTEPIYATLYTGSMKTAIKHNLFKPMTPDGADILVSGHVRRTEIGASPVLIPEGQHLVCFAGGMFVLGGRLFDDEEHVKIGQKLTDGCIWTYRASPLGIMPEVFNMVPCPSRNGDCKWDEEKWKEEIVRIGSGEVDAETAIQEMRLPRGFAAISDRRYILRPEAIESVFILYRTTGQEYLLDAAWDMFQAIVNVTETPIANAALSDVTYSPETFSALKQQVQMDSMESFWLAETLKYFYLIFSEPNVISLDEWVFNTEAHPFKRLLP